MSASILEMLEQPDVRIAVVGANDNPAKFGCRIYRDLKRKGFRVWPVNPKRDRVDGDLCYHSLEDLPEQPDIVNFVVPPPRTLETLKQCQAAGLLNVWLQPGTEDDAVLNFLDQHRFNYLAQTCIMVESRDRAG